MRQNPHRRDFLKAAGLSAASLATLQFTGGAARADDQPAGEKSADGKKLPFSLGLASYTTRKFTLDESLAMANRVGLAKICLKSFHLPLTATAEECAAARAQCEAAGVELYGGGVIKMADEAGTRQAFEYAKAAGMRTIVGVPMPPVLPLVDKLVKEYDIQVAIHNHGPGDKTYPSPESAIEKIKDLDPRIGLCMDIGHTLRIGACPIADARRFADRLLDVHVKDVTEAAASGKTVEIGRGAIDIPGFLKTLIDIGYTGVASFEYEKDPDDPLPGLAESVGYVHGVLATL
jgi:inosose dehydratase